MGHEQTKLERLTFFSDAVFAIAMTLLVIEVRVPHLADYSDVALATALRGLIPNYIGFIVSFIVIARFWTGHHRVMAMLDRSDPRLVRTNLLLLMAIAFMPFPTAVFSNYVDLRVATTFYTGWLIAVGVANMLNVRAALVGRRLVRDDVNDADVRQMLRGYWIPILIGGIALLAGLIAPIFALAVLLIGTPIIGWLFGRRHLTASNQSDAVEIEAKASG